MLLEHDNLLYNPNLKLTGADEAYQTRINTLLQGIVDNVLIPNDVKMYVSCYVKASEPHMNGRSIDISRLIIKEKPFFCARSYKELLEWDLLQSYLIDQYSNTDEISQIIFPTGICDTRLGENFIPLQALRTTNNSYSKLVVAHYSHIHLTIKR